MRRLSVALAGSFLGVLTCVAGAPSASAADGEQVTIDVLTVVDGEYVVDTVTAPRDRAAATEETLEDRADVVAADAAVDYRLDAGTDPLWSADDPQAMSHVLDVWSRTRGAGQVVAVLDTAVDSSHPDLVGAALPGTDTTGLATDPDEWHGTGVAGVIAARAGNDEGSAGMAPEARLLPVRVCSSATCPSAAVARGVLWAADHGADVINMSLSGGYSDVTAAAVRYALDKGISVVASAGNDGQTGNAVMYPAALEGVVAVSATTPYADPAPWAQHGWQVDVSAVGENVLLPGRGGYLSGSGTSFSGPAVAGAVALLRAGHPGISPAQVQAALQAGADSGGTWDRGHGAGRLDVPAAFAAADRAGTAPTVTPSAGTVDVSWPAVAGATQYTVRVDGVVRATVPGTSARVTGLTDGTQVAVDVQPDGGARSLPALASVGAGAPATPTLQAAMLRTSGSSAVLDVTASVSGPVASRYSLLQDGVSVGTYALPLTGSPQTFGLTLGAMPAYETRWQLRGVDDLGRASAASNAITTGTNRPAPPAAPTGLTGTTDGGRVLLSWDDAGPAYTYTVSVGGSVVAGPRTAGATLSAPVGVTRTYAVAVVDAWGQSGPTSTVTLTPDGASPPAAPTGVTAVGGDRSATVSWTAATANGSPVTGYTVTASPGGATATTTGATTATLTGLTNGTWYTLTVTATSAAGTGPTSAAAHAVPFGVPGAPGPVAATPNDGSVALQWTPADGNGSPVTRYTITASPGGATRTTGDTFGSVTGLANGTAYTFTVTATNAAGTGPASTPSPPAVPRSTDPIGQAWAASGGSAGPLGASTAPRVCGLRSGGCFQTFERGAVYWSPGTDARLVLSGPVRDRWAATRWENGALGYPVGDTVCGLAGGGCSQAFQFGSVYSSTAGGARVVWGSIRDRWAASGHQAGPLGYPVGEETCGLTGGGCFQAFERGVVYWSPGTGARLVLSGPVRDRWAATRWETGTLGYPTGDTICGLTGGGCFQQFQGGSVYTSSGSPAAIVKGALRDRWGASGWENGPLGYPTADQVCGLRDGGCFQVFQRGAVYRSTSTGARLVLSGAVRDRWAATRWETGTLGYPTGDTICGLTGGGCFQQFQGGSVYTSSGSPAAIVKGALRDRWGASGWENGPLGYPTADEVCGLRDGGCFQVFQKGSAYWSPASGAHTLTNRYTRDRWGSLGWENGRLGYPVEEERAVPGGTAQRFQGGILSYVAATNEVRVAY
ncbi:S8 family serine peptidase [Modestobacter excelsi]|uniref:S8 family serine peptidase n=1 Tax=Modestobacter excelsi TaxID=2213161 RepID=UPI00110D2110|nr:S8 family serine peptidase [Modestobacter excelsi]